MTLKNTSTSGENLYWQNKTIYKITNQGGSSAAASTTTAAAAASTAAATSAAVTASAALQLLVEHVIENVGLDISGGYSNGHCAFL